MIVALAVVLVIIGGAWGLENAKTARDYGAQNDALLHVLKIKNTEILGVLNEHTSSLTAVKQLQKDFTLFVNTAGPALEGGQATLIAELKSIEAQNAAVCVALHITCTAP